MLLSPLRRTASSGVVGLASVFQNSQPCLEPATKITDLSPPTIAADAVLKIVVKLFDTTLVLAKAEAARPPLPTVERSILSTPVTKSTIES